MSRKKKHEEHENHERWLVSYADFITLLFAFFVSMYAISSVNEGKFRVLSDSLSVAFNPSLYSTVKLHDGPRFVKEQRSHAADEFQEVFDNKYQKLTNALKDLEKEQKLSMIYDHKKITIRISESIVFQPGTDEMVPEALPVIDEIANALKDMSNNVRVEGHTDNIPTNTSRFPSNWDLSSARALKVLKYLVEKHKYDPKRLSASGYGEWRPVASNDTPEGRAKNRRIDLQILNSDGSDGF